MKIKKSMIPAMVAILALACSATAQGTFPLVKLNISGTVSCTNSPTSNGTTTKSALTKVSISTKSLINLLNASPAVTNTLANVTGTNQIPAGAYFLFDLNNQALIVTNKNDFNFPLAGQYQVITNDQVTTNTYQYGFLTIGVGDTTSFANIIGSYSQNNTTLAGSESDLAGIEFFFTDANGNQLDDYGNGSLQWSFGKVGNGVQKTTLSVNFPAPSGSGDSVNYNNAIAQNVKASGSGTGNVESAIFPFYIFWAEP
jgi:hypothetical protein